jgi:hypothetical protein
MTPIQKKAILAIVILLASISATAFAINATNPPAVAAPHVEVNNAWMSAVQARDYAKLNELTCHPSDRNIATIREQVDSVADILNASSRMFLVEAKEENPDTRTILIRTRFELRRDVRGSSEYTGGILVNASTQNYCVLGFVLDSAFWPPRKQIQE